MWLPTAIQRVAAGVIDRGPRRHRPNFVHRVSRNILPGSIELDNFSTISGDHDRYRSLVNRSMKPLLVFSDRLLLPSMLRNIPDNTYKTRWLGWLIRRGGSCDLAPCQAAYYSHQLRRFHGLRQMILKT